MLLCAALQGSAGSRAAQLQFQWLWACKQLKDSVSGAISGCSARALLGIQGTKAATSSVPGAGVCSCYNPPHPSNRHCAHTSREEATLYPSSSQEMRTGFGRTGAHKRQGHIPQHRDVTAANALSRSVGTLSLTDGQQHRDLRTTSHMQRKCKHSGSGSWNKGVICGIALPHK